MAWRRLGSLTTLECSVTTSRPGLCPRDLERTGPLRFERVQRDEIALASFCDTWRLSLMSRTTTIVVWGCYLGVVVVDEAHTSNPCSRDRCSNKSYHRRDEH